MASSGWQRQIYVGSSKSGWVDFYADIRIDGASHEGDSLHLWGLLALCVHKNANNAYAYYDDGVYGYLNGSGGSFGTHFGNGYGGDKYVDFDVWLDCPSGDTSKAIAANFYVGAGQGWNSWPTWTIYFDAAGTAPSGISATIADIKWNSVTGNVKLSSYGSPSDAANRYIEFSIMKPGNTEYGSPYRWTIAKKVNSATLTVDNSSNDNKFGEIIGMMPFKIGAWATNTVMATPRMYSDIYYTPPSPGGLSYTHKESSTEYQVIYTTGTKNYSDIDVKEYDVIITTSLDGEPAKEQHFQISPSSSARLSINIPFGSSMLIRGYQTYFGMESEVSEILIVNSDSPVMIYGAICLVGRKIHKLYAVVDGKTREIIKLYASIGGVTKLIYEKK